MPEFDKESKRIEPQHRELVPHVQRDARVSAQTAPSTTVDRGDMMQAVGDYLKSKTFNGFPINVQGSDIFVARAAFAGADVAQGGVQQATPVTPPELARPVVVAPGVGGPVPGGLVSTGLRSTGLVSTGLQSSGLTTGRVGEVRQDAPAKPSLKGLLKTDPTIRRPNMRRHSDLTMLGHTVVPVRLKRGDGARTILAYLDMTSGFVIEGGVGGEPTTALPAADSFYDALGGSCTGFELKGDGSATDTVSAGTLNGEFFGQYTGALSGDVYAHVTIDNLGVITASAVVYTGSIPADTATNYYVLIGRMVSGSPAQLRCGPIQAQVCRNWFSNPATYSVNWI